MFYRNSGINATSVDHDQTPHFAASDQGLHCLPMSLLWDAKHKWVKKIKKQIRTDIVLVLYCGEHDQTWFDKMAVLSV